MKHPVIRHRKRQSGMTLLEVLVSVLLFSIGILGMVGMQAKAVSISTDAEDRTRAALLANEAVSQIWMAHTLALPAAAVTALQTRAQTASDPLFLSSTATVTLTQTAATSTAVAYATLTITWKASNKAIADASNQFQTQVSM